MQGLYDCAAFNDLRTKGNGQKQAFDRICGMGDWAAGLKDANMMPVAKTLCCKKKGIHTINFIGYKSVLGPGPLKRNGGPQMGGYYF